jgi:hypothetical protein
MHEVAESAVSNTRLRNARDRGFLADALKKILLPLPGSLEARLLPAKIAAVTIPGLYAYSPDVFRRAALEGAYRHKDRRGEEAFRRSQAWLKVQVIRAA